MKNERDSRGLENTRSLESLSSAIGRCDCMTSSHVQEVSGEIKEEGNETSFNAATRRKFA